MKLKNLTFKSQKNTRIIARKKKNGDIFIFIWRVVSKDEFGNYQHYKILREFNNCFLIETGIGFMEETFFRLILFQLSDTKKKFDAAYDMCQGEIKITISK